MGFRASAVEERCEGESCDFDGTEFGRRRGCQRVDDDLCVQSAYIARFQMLNYNTPTVRFPNLAHQCRIINGFSYRLPPDKRLPRIVVYSPAACTDRIDSPL
jgi:hypothetical protein